FVILPRARGCLENPKRGVQHVEFIHRQPKSTAIQPVHVGAVGLTWVRCVPDTRAVAPLRRCDPGPVWAECHHHQRGGMLDFSKERACSAVSSWIKQRHGPKPAETR